MKDPCPTFSDLSDLPKESVLKKVLKNILAAWEIRIGVIFLIVPFFLTDYGWYYPYILGIAIGILLAGTSNAILFEKRTPLA